MTWLRRHFKVKIYITELYLSVDRRSGWNETQASLLCKGSMNFFFGFFPNQNDPVPNGFLGPGWSPQATLTYLCKMRGGEMEATVRIS